MMDDPAVACFTDLWGTVWLRSPCPRVGNTKPSWELTTLLANLRTLPRNRTACWCRQHTLLRLEGIPCLGAGSTRPSSPLTTQQPNWRTQRHNHKEEMALAAVGAAEEVAARAVAWCSLCLRAGSTKPSSAVTILQ